MKNKILKLLSGALCICLVLSFAACGKKDDSSPKLPESSVELNGINATVRYSTDCSDWKEITADSDLFGKTEWASGDIDIVYINIKNQGDASASFKITPVLNAGLEGANFGIVENKRTAYSDVKNAIGDFAQKDVALSESNSYIKVLAADSTTTLAVAVYIPSEANGGNCGVGLKITANELGTASADNGASRQNGRLLVSADISATVNNNQNDVSMTNDDGSFAANISKDSLTIGSIISAKVKTASSTDSSTVYELTLNSNGSSISASVSILVGFGLENVTVTRDGNAVDSTYSVENGMITFEAESGTYTVNYDDKSNVAGVKVTGSDTMFNDLTEAIMYINGLGDDVPKNIVFSVFGEVYYNVPEGQALSFVARTATVDSVTVAGANSTAKVTIPSYSAQLPSLPTANDSAKLLYINLTLDSEKVDNTKHLDYRGNSDIAFRNCTFERAISTRGMKSNVLIDRCEFNAKEYDDTHVGYCYYSITVSNAGSKITVSFTNNKVTGSWGGINLDWSNADYYIANNVFSGFNCSKPAIQLSRATTAVVENNVFSNIINENAIRFYVAYGAESTVIKNNRFDVDYLFYSDTPDVISDYSEFVFEDNSISSTTNLTLGHVTNSGPEATLAHGYIVDTDLNIIE